MVSYASVGLGMLGIVIILYSESHKIDFKILRRELVRIASLDTLGENPLPASTRGRRTRMIWDSLMIF